MTSSPLRPISELVPSLDPLATTPPTPRGPAADPKYPASLDPSNPYGFTDALLRAAKQDPLVTDKHIYFFGYEGRDPHVCLQQWFAAPFTAPRNPYDGDETEVEFPTTEHYMMYHKALLMGDKEVAEKILSPDNAHPSRAKALGREVTNFDLETWQQNADRVVYEGNVRKFGQDKHLRAILLGTGDRELVEASPDDKIWGIGFAPREASGKQAQWGNNGLGKALMKARDTLQAQFRETHSSDVPAPA